MASVAPPAGMIDVLATSPVHSPGSSAPMLKPHSDQDMDMRERHGTMLPRHSLGGSDANGIGQSVGRECQDNVLRYNLGDTKAVDHGQCVERASRHIADAPDEVSAAACVDEDGDEDEFIGIVGGGRSDPPESPLDVNADENGFQIVPFPLHEWSKSHFLAPQHSKKRDGRHSAADDSTTLPNNNLNVQAASRDLPANLHLDHNARRVSPLVNTGDVTPVFGATAGSAPTVGGIGARSQWPHGTHGNHDAGDGDDEEEEIDLSQTAEVDVRHASSEYIYIDVSDDEPQATVTPGRVGVESSRAHPGSFGGTFMGRTSSAGSGNRFASSVGGGGSDSPAASSNDSYSHIDVCYVCGKYGELTLCDGCPRACHNECLGDASDLPAEDEAWMCGRCEEPFERSTYEPGGDGWKEDVIDNESDGDSLGNLAELVDDSELKQEDIAFAEVHFMPLPAPTSTTAGTTDGVGFDEGGFTWELQRGNGVSDGGTTRPQSTYKKRLGDDDNINNFHRRAQQRLKELVSSVDPKFEQHSKLVEADIRANPAAYSAGKAWLAAAATGSSSSSSSTGAVDPEGCIQLIRIFGERTTLANKDELHAAAAFVVEAAKVLESGQDFAAFLAGISPSYAAAQGAADGVKGSDVSEGGDTASGIEGDTASMARSAGVLRELLDVGTISVARRILAQAPSSNGALSRRIAPEAVLDTDGGSSSIDGICGEGVSVGVPSGSLLPRPLGATHSNGHTLTDGVSGPPAAKRQRVGDHVDPARSESGLGGGATRAHSTLSASGDATHSAAGNDEVYGDQDGDEYRDEETNGGSDEHGHSGALLGGRGGHQFTKLRCSDPTLSNHTHKVPRRGRPPKQALVTVNHSNGATSAPESITAESLKRGRDSGGNLVAHAGYTGQRYAAVTGSSCSRGEAPVGDLSLVQDAPRILAQASRLLAMVNESDLAAAVASWGPKFAHIGTLMVELIPTLGNRLQK